LNVDILIDDVMREADSLMPEIAELSRKIFSHPEPAWKEFYASSEIRKILAAEGFLIEDGGEEMPTAIRAFHPWRPEAVHIGFIGEYDALPIGHACGHNLIAASGVGAAIAFERCMQKAHIHAQAVFLGTPAEEGGGGKIHMLDKGMFRDIQYAMMIHPCDATMVEDWSLAGQTVTFRFKGRSAHCAASPWLGANALAAATETINMVNAWRNQFKDYSRVFPIISHGGTATNVIPDFAEIQYNIRSDDREYHKELVDIVIRCAECAASAFGVTVDYSKTIAYAPVKNNPALEKAMKTAFEKLGKTVIPRYRDHGIGSTDMGNVSQALPAIHAHMFLTNGNTHTELFRKAAGGEEGQRYLPDAVKAMAMAGIYLLDDLGMISRSASSGA
jgi:amidohydrolase